MKKSALLVAAALLMAPGVFAADGYYATKADEKAGRVSPGKPAGNIFGAPTVGGDACPGTALPASPGTLPYNDSDTTIGANNTVTSLPAGCSNYTTVAGPDKIYSMVVGSATNSMTVTVTPTGATGYDPATYLINTCPAGTANAITTGCIKGADAGIANQAETFTVSNIAAATYYLFVDSFYSTGAASAGAYTLAVTGTVPVELMKFSVE
jgi:hypothetical protein